jgi:hypothetical protein
MGIKVDGTCDTHWKEEKRVQKFSQRPRREENIWERQM